jgi:hypothetical protein
MYQMNTKCTKWTQNVPNENIKYIKWTQNVYQLALRYSKWPLKLPKSSVARHSKIYPNWDFLFENMRSGNPGCRHRVRQIAASENRISAWRWLTRPKNELLPNFEMSKKMPKMHNSSDSPHPHKEPIFTTLSFNQGCQMVYFQTKNPNLGKILEGLWLQNGYSHLKYFTGILGYFMKIWYILRSFGTFYPLLVSCTKKNLATLVSTPAL